MKYLTHEYYSTCINFLVGFFFLFWQWHFVADEEVEEELLGEEEEDDA